MDFVKGVSGSPARRLKGSKNKSITKVRISFTPLPHESFRVVK